jgi:hypothetical protein
MVNAQIVNIIAMKLETEVFAEQIGPEIEMLYKKILQSFVLSTNTKRQVGVLRRERAKKSRNLYKLGI